MSTEQARLCKLHLPATATAPHATCLSRAAGYLLHSGGVVGEQRGAGRGGVVEAAAGDLGCQRLLHQLLQAPLGQHEVGRDGGLSEGGRAARGGGGGRGDSRSEGRWDPSGAYPGGGSAGDAEGAGGDTQGALLGAPAAGGTSASLQPYLQAAQHSVARPLRRRPVLPAASHELRSRRGAGGAPHQAGRQLVQALGMQAERRQALAQAGEGRGSVPRLQRLQIRLLLN